MTPYDTGYQIVAFPGPKIWLRGAGPGFGLDFCDLKQQFNRKKVRDRISKED